MSTRLLLAGALALLAAPTTAATKAVTHRAPDTGLLPERLLRCTLGRVTNFDPQRDQKAADLRYEGRHSFTLLLPGGPRRTTAPPDPVDPPEPVDPRTRVVADPDGLRRGAANRFDRVVDLWPERVEMTTTISSPLVNLIVIHPIDIATRTANLFMTQATDLTAYDTDHLYQGSCLVESRPSGTVAGR